MTITDFWAVKDLGKSSESRPKEPAFLGLYFSA